MRRVWIFSGLLLALLGWASVPASAYAALTLTAGSNVTTTPNVATAVTGFQIVGPAASSTPVQLRSTSGTLSMTNTTGLTFDGASSGTTINFSGTVQDINNALATLRYSRASTGTDTLEVSLVNKGEIFFTDNGHLYQFVTGGYTWSAAKAAAEAQTAYGASGYLVTITSSTENTFVSQRLSGDGWIGASDSEIEGTWKWVTGPEAGTAFWQGTGGGSAISGRYSAWAGGEPNESGSEDCAETYVASGQWNDFPCGATLGYVVEFGAPGNMPTVTATNISVVTADVPALTSLSPANGATLVSPTANLVLGFSKAVTKQTGNIVIRRASDDGIVETIDASGSQVTGTNTTTVTIDPSVTLPEGTALYVTVPGTAFQDGSSNFFGGFSNTSTWTFATNDVTAPQITSLVATASSTTSTFTWTTNENASTKVLYSVDTSLASSTSETDTSPRVTSHSVTLSGLVACTLYSYKVVSRDAFSNAATSSTSTFLTTGCSGGSTPSSTTSTPVMVASAATSTLTETGRVLSVMTPANFTATSTSIVIQIKSMEADPVLGVIGKPSNGLSTAATVVFEVTALINNTTVLDSFNTPVTVSYQYTDADVAGLDESTLRMYHYRNGLWEALDSCTVNASTNTITCTAPHFSVFAIFGSPAAVASSGSAGQGGSIQARVRALLGMGKVAEATALKRAWYWLFPETASAASPVSASVVRDLQMGSVGEDVRVMQRLLNARGHVIAASGPGSPGNESDTFGAKTRVALTAFQKAQGIIPAHGYYGPATRARLMSLPSTDATSTPVLTTPVRDLDLGMTGDDVRSLQQWLLDHQQTLPAGVTGYFGSQTQAALRAYQKREGISPATGYFGTKTRAALQAKGTTGLWW